MVTKGENTNASDWKKEVFLPGTNEPTNKERNKIILVLAMTTVVPNSQRRSVTVHGEQVEIEPLGSGQEVGRSCVIVNYKGCKVMFDCGVHPALKNINSLPYFPENLDDVDLVLITHFHLDHCAGLPYLCEQTNFKGRIFMTTATKAFFKICMNDFLSVSSGEQGVATREWIDATYNRIETVEYHQEIVHNGIRFQPFNAGHVLGAAMFLVDIAGAKILYTGDFSRTPDRHLLGAEIPPVSPDILIVEATYGTMVLESREEREKKLIDWVSEIVARGGRCLIPVFALGRAQELLLILEEHWEANTTLQRIPIYYASSMAARSMKQYKTYVSGMSDWVKDKHEANVNPFDFKFIRPLKDSRSFEDSGPCVVLASPGMLQSGVSYELFARWCGHENNGVIFAGYCTDGTLAKKVIDKQRTIVTDDGKTLTVKMKTIGRVCFSAHSDGKQTKEFISALQTTQHVVLVHGQGDPMRRLRDSLMQEPSLISRGIQVYTPKNKEKVSVPFATQRVAKVLGSLVKSAPKDGEFVHGVLLVNTQHKYTIVHPRDITTFTGLQTVSVHQAMVLPLAAHRSEDEILAILKTYFAQSEMFHDVTPAKGEDVNEDAASSGNVSRINVAGSVHLAVEHDTNSHTTVTVRWTASSTDDLVADITCVALVHALTGGADNKDLLAGRVDSADDAPLPVELNTIDSAADRAFRFKCFHHMLSQFYNNVKTNLATGECYVRIMPNVLAKVIDGIRITYPQVTDKSIFTRESFLNEQRKLADVLKRTYLTLFPIPADAGWCDCGKFHYDDSLDKYVDAAGPTM